MSILEAELFVNFLYNPFREPLRLGGYAACYSDFRATSGSKKIKPDIAQNVISKWYSMNFWLKIGEVLFSIVFIFLLSYLYKIVNKSFEGPRYISVILLLFVFVF